MMRLLWLLLGCAQGVATFAIVLLAIGDFGTRSYYFGAFDAVCILGMMWSFYEPRRRLENGRHRQSGSPPQGGSVGGGSPSGTRAFVQAIGPSVAFFSDPTGQAAAAARVLGPFYIGLHRQICAHVGSYGLADSLCCVIASHPEFLVEGQVICMKGLCGSMGREFEVLVGGDAPPLKQAPLEVGEIIAYRAWILGDDGVLTSCYMTKCRWIAGQVMQAAIVDPYAMGEGGGFHAFKSPSEAQLYWTNHSHLGQGNQIVSGTIAMWGDVIEHETGYRCEFARIRSLDQLFPPEIPGVEILPLLRERYCPDQMEVKP